MVNKTPTREPKATRQAKRLDKRDRNLLHMVRVASEHALDRSRLGHNDGWRPLQDALDKCDDELGYSEDFIP